MPVPWLGTVTVSPVSAALAAGLGFPGQTWNA